jgi:protein MpaA
VPPTTAAPSDFLGEEIVGTSAGGRPISARHRGTPGGAVVLVVGVIHGNEDAGLAVLDLLDTLPLPPGIDLWLMPAMNPDGLADQQRGNANGVDLNRNFPHDWTAIGSPGEWQYSGTGPASEPETQAFIDFTSRIRPVLTLWYHQDLYRISPSKGADSALRARYAELTGLPLETVTGGIYTGVAATWVRTTLPEAMSFIIELGPSLSAEEALVHAVAVLDIASMAQALRT